LFIFCPIKIITQKINLCKNIIIILKKQILYYFIDIFFCRETGIAFLQINPFYYAILPSQKIS